MVYLERLGEEEEDEEEDEDEVEVKGVMLVGGGPATLLDTVEEEERMVSVDGWKESGL